MKPRAAVVLSIVLLAVAAALLARGLVATPGTSLFVASITVSIVAAVALAWSGRSAPVPHPVTDDPRWLRAGGEWSPAAPVPAQEAAPAPAPAPATSDGAVDRAVDESAGASVDDAVDDDLDFPIADYDDLTLPEVLGLLPQLYSDELDVVEGRERRGASRAEVLETLAHLRQHGTEADAEYAARLAEHEAAGRAADEAPTDATG
jgi:hypothetical protein